METLKKSIQCKFIALKRSNLVSLNQNIRPMVKKRMIMIFIALMAWSSLNAQNQTSTIPKWEVGTDLLWLINKNTLPEYSMIVKRSFLDRSAIRCRVGLGKVGKLSSIFFTPDKSQKYIVRLGYERRKELMSGLSMLYGLDLSYYSTESFISALAPQAWINSGIPGPAPIFLKLEKAKEWGLIPFVGLNYQLNDHLSISAESTFNIIHETITISKTQVYEPDISVSRYNIYFVPITTINFLIHF